MPPPNHICDDDLMAGVIVASDLGKLLIDQRLSGISFTFLYRPCRWEVTTKRIAVRNSVVDILFAIMTFERLSLIFRQIDFFVFHRP